MFFLSSQKAIVSRRAVLSSTLDVISSLSSVLFSLSFIGERRIILRENIEGERKERKEKESHFVTELT